VAEPGVIFFAGIDERGSVLERELFNCINKIGEFGHGSTCESGKNGDICLAGGWVGKSINGESVGTIPKALFARRGLVREAE
jgi:hypothetical protein